MPIKLNSTNGSVTLNPEDGVGNVDLTVPRSGFTTFSSAAENIAGTVENKAVDPLGIREAFNCTGSAPVYACRAWVNFNGIGTVAIRASGNVSSITDNGAGNYTVNFTTAMPDANYSVTGVASYDHSTANNASTFIDIGQYTAYYCSLILFDASSIGAYDTQSVFITIHR